VSPWCALLGALVVGCGGGRPKASEDGARAAMVFTGACDASGAALLRGSLVVVADDEDNHLRIYDAAAPGPPIQVIDTRAALADPTGKDREMDLEAAARIGDRIYWLASHGRKKSGKPAPSRLRLFATDVVDGRLSFVGTAYAQLVDDLAALPELDLAAAAARSPSAEGGLNIEGLDGTSKGQLLLGFRSPLVGGRALVVPIENPAAVVERGVRAVLGAPQQIDLAGRGVRAMEWDGREHWIVAGAPAARRMEPRLYRWDGSGAPRWVESVRFGPLNPEALARVGDRFLVLSDDGELRYTGRACKKLKDARARRFRAVWLAPPSAR
jgi:hypothetical protein